MTSCVKPILMRSWTPTDVQRRWSQFKAVFLDIMEQCIPKAVLPQRRNLPWLTKEILQLIEKRNYYFKKAHSNRNSSDLLKFKQLRNKVVSKLRLAKQKFYSQQDPSSPEEFWKKLNPLNFKDSSISTLSSELLQLLLAWIKQTLLSQRTSTTWFLH